MWVIVPASAGAKQGRRYLKRRTEMIALFTRLFGEKERTKAAHRHFAQRRPRLGQTLLAAERLEPRELLAGDVAAAQGAMVTDPTTNGAPTALVATQQPTANMNANFISDQGPGAPGTSFNPTGSLGTGAISDQGPGAPGTSFNPTGSQGTGAISDQGPGAPGTSFNPTGSLGTGAISDQGPGAPGTSFNPTGSLGTGAISDQGPGAPGTSFSTTASHVAAARTI
jgi:hypothetical protein